MGQSAFIDAPFPHFLVEMLGKKRVLSVQLPFHFVHELFRVEQ